MLSGACFSQASLPRHQTSCGYCLTSYSPGGLSWDCKVLAQVAACLTSAMASKPEQCAGACLALLKCPAGLSSPDSCFCPPQVHSLQSMQLRLRAASGSGNTEHSLLPLLLHVHLTSVQKQQAQIDIRGSATCTDRAPTTLMPQRFKPYDCGSALDRCTRKQCRPDHT